MIPALAQVWPDLAGAEVTPLGAGSDARAWLVGGRVVVKAPRDAAALAREARVLAVVRPRLRLPVPDMRFHPGPPALSRHDLLPGVQLLAPVYDALPEATRDGLAADLAAFHADCHALPPDLLRQAGAGPVQPWPAPSPAVLPLLPVALRPLARRVLRDWAALPPDPLGDIWGHFDAHGWNMAYDRDKGQLAGIYDFGDSGFGPLHRDLIYSALISPDLTRRLGLAYARLTGRRVEPGRLRVLSGAHRLWELASAAAGDRAFQVAAFVRWAGLA